MSENSNPILDLLVIGGGASGMCAAIAYQKRILEISQSYADVLILEKNDRVGKKVLATGNGRCNLSNKDMELSHFHSRKESFPGKILEKVPPLETLAFLNDIGIVTTSEGNKIFPMSKVSSSVVDAFRSELTDLRIRVASDTVVSGITAGDPLTVSCEDGRVFYGRKVIVACGGACAPALGTTGDGYRWLSSLGHKVYAPKPSIVQLVTENAVTKPLSGLKADAQVSLIEDGCIIASQFGEVLFTDYGLSGPAVFQISGEVSRRMRKGRLAAPIYVSLQIFDEITIASLSEELRSRLRTMSQRPIEQLLLSILPGKIGTMILKTALDRPLSLPISSLSESDIRKILGTLRDWRFDVLGTRSLEYAQTTIGGADCDEFCEDSLESLIVPSLYACGEVLDVDGDCGGYNLQWAFSSGIAAGRAAAEKEPVFRDKEGGS
ncbi:MAG: aminoacetone oxidase family FAD-binding enzyme [Clostridiales bacterium]|nr:aminoacetone oxidase family FAD-binding enzyme [Clostridiales bacterium]